MRAAIVVASGLVGAALLMGLARGPVVPSEILHLLSVASVALAAAAWMLFPFAGGFATSVGLLVCVGWAWAARQTELLQFDAMAFTLLTVAAAVQRRRRARRLTRMRQTLDDAREGSAANAQAIALANQHYAALHKKLSRYLQLQSIAERLSGMTDLESMTRLAVDRAFELIGKSDACLLFLLDHQRQELSLSASRRRDAVPLIREKHGDQFDRYVLRAHRPLLVNDTRRDFRFTAALSSERTVSSVIASPLLLGQHPEGLLRLDSPQANAYTQDDLRFLDILLNLVATGIANAKLLAQTRQLATMDGLTGLTLRRPLLEQLTREVTRAGRSREAVSMLLVDVDHFKEYNDTFGHTAGDLLLKLIAEALREAMPPGSVIARYGGEEFAVVLPGLTRDPSREVAERVRGLIEQRTRSARVSASSGAARHATPDRQPGAVRGPEEGVTVSVGVASFPQDAQVELELVRVADCRLYQAKRSGRNRVCAS
ncbi:MAG: sensor domain-containing diguanylate cyclase [Candidatus Omnitrophota bacterium]|nr:sensor domain-containing diguanylate cyclase [Candidatus Omnitrophota bacterium]